MDMAEGGWLGWREIWLVGGGFGGLDDSAQWG